MPGPGARRESAVSLARPAWCRAGRGGLVAIPVARRRREPKRSSGLACRIDRPAPVVASADASVDAGLVEVLGRGLNELIHAAGSLGRVDDAAVPTQDHGRGGPTSGRRRLTWLSAAPGNTESVTLADHLSQERPLSSRGLSSSVRIAVSVKLSNVPIVRATGSTLRTATSGSRWHDY
jgi:hypothetical protein